MISSSDHLAIERFAAEKMEDNNNVTFLFQVGLVRDLITTDASQLTLKTLKDLACNFINQKVR